MKIKLKNIIIDEHIGEKQCHTIFIIICNENNQQKKEEEGGRKKD